MATMTSHVDDEGNPPPQAELERIQLERVDRLVIELVQLISPL